MVNRGGNAHYHLDAYDMAFRLYQRGKISLKIPLCSRGSA